MELKHLKTFQCVANFLNFSKAAEVLNFSQPTVSTQIQTLEQELNQKLFIHLGKKTYLTSAGKILKEYVDELFVMVDKIENHFNEMGEFFGHISIAAYETYCTINLPPVISKYLQDNKEVNLELYSCFTKEVIKGVKENDYDIGIVSGVVEYPGVMNIPIGVDRMEIVVSDKLYQKYTREEIFQECTYIKYRADAPDYDADIKAVLQKSGWIPKRQMEFRSLAAIKQAVLDGIGISIMTEDIVKAELKSGRIVSLTPPDINVMSKTSIIVLEEKAKLNEIESFILLLKKMWKM